MELDLLPHAALHLDASMTVLDANAAAAGLIGVTVDDLIGSSAAEMYAPRDDNGVELWADGWHRSSQLASVTGIPEQAVTLAHHSGDDVVAHVAAKYLRDHAGSLTGAVLVLRESAHGASSGPSGIEVVSTVSHELRSPLTSVKGYTSLMLNRWDRLKDDDKKSMLEQVQIDADRVTRLVTELLDISRLETGRLVLRRTTIDIRELIDAVVAKVTLAYPTLTCTVTCPETLPKLYADPDKIQQVVTNLVENAAKYGSPIDMTVDVSLDEAAEAVRIAVTDKGDGIPPDDLPKVFRKFFRADHGKPTGTGLGLWISRGLVQAHKGKLVAESVVGDGTTFWFTLPTTAFEDLHGQS